MRRISCRLLALALLGSPLFGQNELPPPEMTEYWSPQPVIVSAQPGQVPSDAIVLFDGTSLDAWESAGPDGGKAPWDLVDGALVVKPKSGDIRTQAAFGDVQLHLEWRAPLPIVGKSQGRGNSGVFFMERYEVQVLDSHRNPTYVNGGASSVYKQHPPLVNATQPPGEWNTYDIVFVAPRFDAGGKLTSPARVTVFHNGVLTQLDVHLAGPTEWRGLPSYKYHVPRLPIKLQDHGNPMAFRNIWVRELTLPTSTIVE
ncbi:3-keto-disaccharide hydrolase [Synoicihabitans lomoniglobus]|uniref:DUF1080 domain-containing protein n=1 Tax=Synoicihabitans lomoniglobus TaxID=2909285 RepID=A0AAF0CRL5_9BACT|nr:DUF1080 domain-containing protein [Opitutaceae bacterium LMO-M01]WED66696.1 DUF1080 domain-containing protein [Opitutaceae bacterium LMO-M01]